MFSEFDPRNPALSFEQARIEVQRWFKLLATLSDIERKEALDIFNAETDVFNKEPNAQEALDALIKARSERLEREEYAKLEAEEAAKKAQEEAEARARAEEEAAARPADEEKPNEQPETY